MIFHVQFFLVKLAANERNDKSDKPFLLTSKLCRLELCLRLPGCYIHVLILKKKCIISDFKEIFF